jgi:PAS domain S-box-containing protein
MIAPLLCASILFTLPVIIATWLSAFLSCFGVILVYSGHVDIAVENSIVFATISGLIAWVLYKKSDELRTTSNKWNSLFTSMSEGVLVQDPDCTITDCNPAAERIFGLSYQQMIGMKPCNFLCQLTFEDGRLFTQEHSPVLMVVRSNQPVGPLQVSFIRDGQRRWVRYSVEPIRHRNGIISKVVTSFHDTTEQINANTELKKSEERFKQLAEVFPETIFEADTEGNLTYVNKHGLECFGMSPDVQVRGLNLFQVVHTDAHALLKERMDERLAGKVGGYSEFKAVTTNRTVFEALAYTAPVKDESENIIGIRGFILDISDRKKMERTLIESEALLMCLFENLPVGVAISIRRLIPLNR